MRAKHLLSSLSLVMLLAACGKQTLAFRLTFDTQDTLRRQELAAAAGRVAEGRMIAREKEVLAQEIKDDGDGMLLTMTVTDAQAAEWLIDGLTTPFSMAIMQEVDKGKPGALSTKFGDFTETGITTEDFDWVTVGALQDGKGSVSVSFTPAGGAELKKVFSANRGKVIGIFVRGQLMSKKLIDKNDTQAGIAVDGIPSAELAAGFADDVNTGLHVTFTPVP